MPRSDTYPGALDQLPSGTWRWRVQVNGELHTYTWKNVDEAEAERKARNKYDTLTGKRARGGATDVRLGALIELYREEQLPELAESSQASYETALKSLERYYQGDRDPLLQSLSRGDVKSYLSWRKMHSPDGEEREESLSAWSVRQTKAVLSTLFEEAVEREWMEANPARRVSVETPSREPVILSEEEYGELLEAAQGRAMLPTFFLLGGEAGLRRGEAFDLRWTDLDLADGFLNVVSGREGRQTKGKRSRAVPMTTRLRSALRDHAARWRLDGTGSEYVLHHTRNWSKASAGDPFARLRESVNNAADEAGLPDEWRFHDLRHRRCTLWLAEGYSPEKVRRCMGHADLSTTLQYSHLLRSDLEEMVGKDPERAALEDMVG